ncbi:MAG: T9SS type A sorting domain-containing protein [Patescibacteria group bacterium]|nr:T9SS type A sorting domain-containing protein [Patescibacteria group bacterium]
MLTTWCGFGQISFNFSPMSNPDPNLENLGQVLLVGDEALSGTGNFQMYYNGNSWSVLPASPVGAISGREINNRIYAVSIGSNLNLWNDSVKSWQVASAKPTQMVYGVSPFVKGENDVYFVGFDQAENVGWLWHWDGGTFSDLRSDYWYSYCGVYAKDANNIFLISNKNINYDAMFIRFNNITKSWTVLYTFPDDRGNPRVIVSKDNNIFFILTDLGDIYRWTNSSSQMDKVFSYSTSNIGFSDNMIVIDNDNIISCGAGGIRHVKVSTGQHTTLYPTSMNFFISGASYNGNGRAMFTGKGGLILDMQVIGSVPDEDIANALNLYPNPAENSVTLEFPVFGVNEKTVELYSSTGQLVKEEKFQSFKTTLDISTLPSGIYLVNVEDNTGKKLAGKKLIVK